MGNIHILQSAREVDEIMNPTFRATSRQTRLIAPEGITLDNQKLFIFYGLSPREDGRVLASRFLDILEQEGGYQFARPLELDDPNLDFVAFARIPQEVINRVAVASERRPGTTDLLSYSRGELQIVDENKTIQFYVRGALPDTQSFSVRSTSEQDRNRLYNKFVESLENNLSTSSQSP